MTLQEFEKLVDAYGADFVRWPVALRDQAVVLHETSPEAQAMMAEARALDGLLEQAPVGEVHASLVADILATAPAPQLTSVQTQPSQGVIGRMEDIINALWPQSGWVRPAGLLGATLAFGFYMGFASPDGLQSITAEEEDVFASIFFLPEASDWDTGELQ